jgi:hypothetical protein
MCFDPRLSTFGQKYGKVDHKSCFLKIQFIIKEIIDIHIKKIYK